MIADLVTHRGYIWRTAWLDVRNRYAGAGLGAVWNILQPLAMILVFTLVFTQLMTGGKDLGAPYPVYLCSALLPWQGFADCITRGTHSFISNAAYLRRLPIPEQVFVAQSAVASAISLSVSFVVLVLIAAVMGHHPSWHWLLLPIPLALLIGLGFGLGLALGTLNAFIRDVGQVVPILMQVWFWLYPVVYHVSNLPETMQRVVRLNPVFPYMESIRALFIERTMPDPGLWLGMAAWTAVAGLAGFLVLRRLRTELRDVI